MADEGAEPDFRRWATLGPTEAPDGSPDEFLAMCGPLHAEMQTSAG